MRTPRNPETPAVRLQKPSHSTAKRWISGTRSFAGLAMGGQSLRRANNPLFTDV